MQESSGYCSRCEKQVMIRRPTASHAVHLILTLITVGLWLPIWVLSSIQIGGWRCTVCGKPCPRTFEGKDWALVGVAAVAGFLAFTGLGQGILGSCRGPGGTTRHSYGGGMREERVEAKPKPKTVITTRELVEKLDREDKHRNVGVLSFRYEADGERMIVELGDAWWRIDREIQDAMAKNLAEMFFIPLEYHAKFGGPQDGLVEFVDAKTGICVGRFSRAGGGME